MCDAQFLKTRVSSETKARVRSRAKEELITESVWVKRLVMAALRERESQSGNHRGRETAAAAVAEKAIPLLEGPDPRLMRICIRLRRQDQILLRERGRARGLPAATYVSVLVRAHLRRLAPLPKEELLALKRSVAELGALGRNLDQIAKAAHLGSPDSVNRDHVRSMLKISEALRDNVKIGRAHV